MAKWEWGWGWGLVYIFLFDISPFEFCFFWTFMFRNLAFRAFDINSVISNWFQLDFKSISTWFQLQFNYVKKKFVEINLTQSTFFNKICRRRQIFFRQTFSTNLRSTFFVVDKVDVSLICNIFHILDIGFKWISKKFEKDISYTTTV